MKKGENAQRDQRAKSENRCSGERPESISTFYYRYVAWSELTLELGVAELGHQHIDTRAQCRSDGAPFDGNRFRRRRRGGDHITCARTTSRRTNLWLGCVPLKPETERPQYHGARNKSPDPRRKAWLAERQPLGASPNNLVQWLPRRARVVIISFGLFGWPLPRKGGKD